MTRTRADVIADAGRVWARACARMAALTPREQAEEAYRPGGPSVDELEARIRAQRGMPALDRSGPPDTSPPTG